MDWITNPEIWIALVTLTSLEIVLGIDNIVFISILASKLPPALFNLAGASSRARRGPYHTHSVAVLNRVGDPSYRNTFHGFW